MTRKELAEKICNENWLSDDCCNAFINGWEEADKHPIISWTKVSDKKPPVVEEIPTANTVTKATKCVVYCQNEFFVGYAAYDYVEEADGETSMMWEDEECKIHSLAWYGKYGDYIEELGDGDYYFPLPELPEGGKE